MKPYNNSCLNNRLRYYYYKLLDKKERELYDFLEEHIWNYEKTIEIAKYNLSIDSIRRVQEAIYNDNPMMYFMDPYKFSYNVEHGCVSKIIFEYIYSKKECEQYNKTIYKEIDLIKRKCANRNSFDSEQIIHDYLTTNIIYAKDKIALGMKENRRTYSVVGALIDKKAVCHGIECAFKLFCDCIGIKCLVALGKANELTSGNGHAWNIVQIEKSNYHVDTTWNLIKDKSKYGKYNYFNLTDEDIRSDHYWDESFYPKCMSIKHNFYFHKNLYANNYHDIEKLIKYFIENKKKFLPIRCICFDVVI